MLKNSTRVRPALRLLSIAAGAGLIAYLTWRAGPGNLWQQLVKLGWGFALVIALAGVAHLVKTWAWRMTLGKDQRKFSFPRLLGLRLGAEAASQLGIIGQTLGDSMRVSQLSREVETANSLASVTLDRGFYVVTGIIVAIAGLVAALPMLSLSHALRLYASLFVIGSVIFLLLTLLAVRKRWPLLSGTARLVGRVPSLNEWIDRRLHLIQSTEHALFDFHHNAPKQFWAGFSLNLIGQCLAIVEVCVVLCLLGANIGLVSALVIEALTKLVNAVGNFNPGNVGTYEGGNLLIGKIFGLSSATALALALARRSRAIFWTAIGGVCLAYLIRKKNNPNRWTVTEDRGAPVDTTKSLASMNEVSVAIFLPAEGHRHTLARVGALPIPLRTILDAQRMNPAQIVVVADPRTRRIVERELMSTRRLPPSVRWLETSAKADLRECLQLVAAEVSSQRVVLADGSTTYHPSLIRQACEWNTAGTALILTSSGGHAPLYTLPVGALHDLAGHRPAEARGLEEFDGSIRGRHSLTSVEVSEDLWQRVRTEKDRRIAEEKLDRWLVKPTDGMYARFNRRISIPISRQLIKLPITANMVSIFTLGVGIASATFFALGGYWNTLLGALLCVFASILDGCDGEVARLKLLESDFGCWLETVCDYAFYLFLVVGMTIGLWRSSGTKSYLAWGAVLLLGALASFLAVSWQRHRMAAGRPEQFLGIWQSKAQKRSSNPFLYAARHTEFIVRRCFFPYALVAFALLGFMNIAFILSVIGANLVWPIALYSGRAFAGTTAGAVTRRAASAEA
jgi:uncharacterized protein (TIRG00374 family)